MPDFRRRADREVAITNSEELTEGIDILPVVMCGGTGTRLWPLSRTTAPKQFIPLIDGDNLFNLTIQRLAGIDAVGEILCVTNESHRFMVNQAYEQFNLGGQILLEPVVRNTAPALTSAALWSLKGDRDPVLICLPSDHFFPDTEEFSQAIVAAARAASDGRWVTLGVKPRSASDAFGYLMPKPSASGSSGIIDLERFVEKPDVKQAEQLIENGAMWNAGINVVRASSLVSAMRLASAGTVENCTLATENAQLDGRFVRLEKNSFSRCAAQSMDYAVLEHHDNLAMIALAQAWNDIGSWSAIADISAEREVGNRAVGDAVFEEARGNYIHSPEKLAVAIGVEDLIIVNTADAVLVSARDKSSSLRRVVEQLAADGRKEVETHRRVVRPWGSYECIDSGPGFQVKRITVNSGSSLSLQYHHHRAEHWVVVEGEARVTRDDETIILHANESTYIPKGAVHRLENTGSGELQLIEVQSGSYLGEDDIVRLEDDYGRVSQRSHKNDPAN